MIVLSIHVCAIAFIFLFIVGSSMSIVLWLLVPSLSIEFVSAKFYRFLNCLFFLQAHSLDPCVLQGMDSYAFLLSQGGRGNGEVLEK